MNHSTWKNVWTEAEDATMREHYKRLGGKACVDLLPGRTFKAIQQRAVSLSLSTERGAPWTPEEDALLMKLWPSMGVACTNQFFDRSKTSVQTRARKLRLMSVLARKPKALPPTPETVSVTRISFGEPLVVEKADMRKGRGCFGVIPGGPVASVFDLAKESA